MEVTLDITAFTEVGLSKEESTVLEAASLLVAHYSKSGLMEKLPPQSSIWVQRAKDALQVVRAPFSEKLPRRIRWRDVAIVLMEMNRLKNQWLDDQWEDLREWRTRRETKFIKRPKVALDEMPMEDYTLARDPKHRLHVEFTEAELADE